MRRWVALCGLAGCVSPTGPGVDGDPLETPDGACVDAPILGREGGFGHDRLPLRWRWSEGVWVSDVVRAWVPEDVRGLALTADGGDAPTGFAWIGVGGRVVFDITGRKRFRQRGALDDLLPVAAFPDTFETGSWDTAAGPGGGVDGLYAPPLFHAPSVAATIALPLNDGTRPWGGCLEAVAFALDAPTAETLNVATKRSGRAARRLDVDVVVIDGLDVSDAEIGDAIAVAADLYASGGALALGEVGLWSVDLPWLDVDFEGPRARELRGVRLPGASPWSLRIFLVRDVLGAGGTLGYAAGIPGPVGVPGTAGSGVIVALDLHRKATGALDVQTLGETFAHEGGHQLGLFHTSEEDGRSFDVIADTPECTRAHDVNGDGSLSAGECADLDGRNFMFWSAGGFRQDQVSAEQARMLSRSPVAVREDE